MGIELLTTAFQKIVRVKIKSITDRLFIYAMVCLLLLVTAATMGLPTWVLIVVAVFSLSLLIAALYFYSYFAFKNPDYLRSEEYQMQSKGIALLGNEHKRLGAKAEDVIAVVRPYALNEQNKTEENA